MFANVAPNGSDQGGHTVECTPADALARDLGEKALNEIQPRSAGRGEVEMKARMLREPRLHCGVLVGAAVVENEMDVLTARRVAIDRVQERH